MPESDPLAEQDDPKLRQILDLPADRRPAFGGNTTRGKNSVRLR